jgi:hypothetical protein
MCLRPPRTVKAWVRTHLACCFLMATPAGWKPAYPEILTGVTHSVGPKVLRRPMLVDASTKPPHSLLSLFVWFVWFVG